MSTVREALIDRNGDGIPDDLSARLVLELSDGRVPRPFWSALMDLMARLGLEAAALPFPLVVPVDRVSELGDDVRRIWIRSVDDLNELAWMESGPIESRGATRESSDDHGDMCLTAMFNPGGMLRDNDGDLIPDATAVGFEIPPEMGVEVGAALANLAARIGLESSGVTLPLVSERGRQFVVRPEDGLAEISLDGAGWLATGDETQLAALIERVAACWPHISTPEAGGVHSSVDRLARAMAGHQDAGAAPGEMLWELQWAAEWEVPRLITAFQDRVLRRLDSKHPVRITVFASESEEIRAALVNTLRQEAERHGLNVESVRVFCTFKAGLSWMRDEVIPSARLVGAESLEIEYQRYEPDHDEPPAFDMPIRWLQELFPADEIAARELGIEVDKIGITERVANGHTYLARARDAAGREMGSWTCDLLTAERPYLARFPDEGTVCVTTSGIIVEQGESHIVERVESDLERFWNFWQGEVLPRVVRLADETGAKIGHQPFFGRLEADVTLSEPNSSLGIREENDSAAEALHEDIYFNTLDTFEVLGLRISGEKTSAPGAVVPVVRVGSRMPPHARVRLFAPPARPRREISDAQVVALRLNDGALQPVIEILGDGLEASDALRAARSLVAGEDSIRALARIGTEEVPVDLPLPAALSGGKGSPDAPPMDELINGERAIEYATSLAGFPELTAWIEERSFQGRPIPALALRSPTPGRLAPPLKSASLKPTALIVARHHANEISSTNAAFRLAYLCATDPAWRALLDRLNIVILPFENADGAALHEWLAADPDAVTWKHHPARYNALGFEFSEDFHNPQTRYGESRARPAMWRRCLPDVLVDNHGVPSHEWVQPFAGFGSPPRFGMSYWLPQALIYGIIRSVDDDRFPEHQQASDALCEAVSSAVAETDLAAWNAAYYRSYRQWGQEREAEKFPGELHEGMLWHLSTGPAGSEERSFAARYPKTTVLNWVTEVNDETAQGEHLHRVARAHLIANRAMLYLMAESAPDIVDSTVQESDGRTTYRRGRSRPLALGRD